MRPAARVATSAVGVEHELRLWAMGEQIDFREVIGRVAGHIAQLDPGDPRARRLPSGVALTADGYEAELASPPLPPCAESLWQIDDLLRAERTELRDRVTLHGVTDMTGYSTHLNMAVDDEDAVELGRRFVSTCVLALAALTEPAASLGVFVRPRRGRLEFGGDYVEGSRLVAALTLFIACVAGLGAGSSPASRSVPRLEPSREKFGWFVPPGELDASSFAEVWTWARPFALGAGLDPGVVDAQARSTVRGSDMCTFARAHAAGPAVDAGPRRLPGGIEAETEWMTWKHVVWVFRHTSGRACRAVVPLADEGGFLADVDSGALATALLRMLRPSVRRRQLLVHSQLNRGGLYHEVRPGALVPAERCMDGSVPRVSRRAARRDLLASMRSPG